MSVKSVLIAALVLFASASHGQRIMKALGQASFGYGLNTNLMADDELVHEWGSNVFIYNVSKAKKFGDHFGLVYGLGLSWFNYKFKEDSTTLLHDTSFGDKRKLRSTRVNVHLGPRLSLGLDGQVTIQALFYGSYGIVNSYRRWDTIGGREYLTSTKDIKYLNPWDYGVKLTFGFDKFAFFANYRLSELFRTNAAFPNVAPLSLGIELLMINND